MRKAIILFICLLLSGSTLPSVGQSWKTDEKFKAFWQKFRTAVISGDKETIVGLSSFPIRMPGRVRSIKDPADLRLRYQEVFNKRTNAAKCFKRDDSEPVGQSEGGRPKEYAIFCYVGGGDEVVFSLKLTRTGWKFVQFSQQTLVD
jgi:hypothetical protein